MNSQENVSVTARGEWCRKGFYQIIESSFAGSWEMSGVELLWARLSFGKSDEWGFWQREQGQKQRASVTFQLCRNRLPLPCDRRYGRWPTMPCHPIFWKKPPRRHLYRNRLRQNSWRSSLNHPKPIPRCQYSRRKNGWERAPQKNHPRCPLY